MRLQILDETHRQRYVNLSINASEQSVAPCIVIET